MVDVVVKTPEFLPFASVGIFRFGTDITQYKNTLETLMSLEQNIMNLPTQIY